MAMHALQDDHDVPTDDTWAAARLVSYCSLLDPEIRFTCVRPRCQHPLPCCTCVGSVSPGVLPCCVEINTPAQCQDKCRCCYCPVRLCNSLVTFVRNVFVVLNAGCGRCSLLAAGCASTKNEFIAVTFNSLLFSYWRMRVL